ncbi:hypothetical protein Q1695_007744 [Nippostrongylus brasiliensis]|nr:hypothetical protein Q1695_007744 [Nippostrongylus brasiliensis]
MLQFSTYGVYKMEHIPKEHRFWVAAVIAWAPNYILLNGIAYLSQDWRTLQRALVFVTIPAAPLLYIVSESPRWLLQTGKTDEALRVLRRIQHIDGAKKERREEMEETINAINSQLLSRKKAAKSYNVRHLFYTRQMTLATIVLCVGVFFTSVINYGLVFNIDALHGSFFINSVLMGSIRWLINILFAVLDYKVQAVGRKTVHFISQASIAASLAIISVTFILGLETVYPSVIRVLALYAAATVAQIYITKNISTVEFYPTVIRNSAIAFKSMWARLGTVCAPQLFVLTFWPPLPWVVIAILATLDTTFFQIVIPETKGKPMPESLPKKHHKIKQHHTSYFDRIDKL